MNSYKHIGYLLAEALGIIFEGEKRRQRVSRAIYRDLTKSYINNPDPKDKEGKNKRAELRKKLIPLANQEQKASERYNRITKEIASGSDKGKEAEDRITKGKNKEWSGSGSNPDVFSQMTTAKTHLGIKSRLAAKNARDWRFTAKKGKY